MVGSELVSDSVDFTRTQAYSTALQNYRLGFVFRAPIRRLADANGSRRQRNEAESKFHRSSGNQFGGADVYTLQERYVRPTASGVYNSRQMVDDIGLYGLEKRGDTCLVRDVQGDVENGGV